MYDKYHAALASAHGRLSQALRARDDEKAQAIREEIAEIRVRQVLDEHLGTLRADQRLALCDTLTGAAA